MINTNDLMQIRIFKNYKELCAYLGEEPKTANSKKAQLKEWERYFSFTKDGQKIIITEVYDIPKDKVDNRTGNNFKNVMPMMNYVMSTIDDSCVGIPRTSTKWVSHVLHILNYDVCRLPFQDEKDITNFCISNNIYDIKLFKDYVATCTRIANNLFVSALSILSRKQYVTYEDGYRFYYQGFNSCKTIFVKDINELVIQTETEICEKIKEQHFPTSTLKGRQLLFLLSKNKYKKHKNDYHNACMELLNDNNDVLCTINDSLWDKDARFPDFVDGDDKRLLSYYEAFSITSIKHDYVGNSTKDEVLDIIKKLAIKKIRAMEYSYHGERHKPYDNDDSMETIKIIDSLLFCCDNEQLSLLECDQEEIEIDNELPDFDFAS